MTPRSGRSGVEPRQQGRTNQPAEQDAERAFQIPETRKEHDMSTEISTQRASGLALATFDDAFRFAKMVAASDFAPKDFRGKPESCLLAIQHGSEVGLSPMQSLQSIACINGRPSVWGDAALALVIGSPVCEYVRETVDGDGDSMVATCEAKRRGYDKPTVVRFSVADAKKAGLWGKTGPWVQYSRRMMQMRARGFALRDAFPDVLRGLVTAEEAQDYPQAEPAREPAREPVVVRPKFEATAVATATPDDMERSRLAVSKAAKVGDLERMQSVTEQRLRTGFYTPAQADELLNLINGKLDILTSEPEDAGQEFPGQAAMYEVPA
jgi:hypothetical protein